MTIKRDKELQKKSDKMAIETLVSSQLLKKTYLGSNVGNILWKDGKMMNYLDMPVPPKDAKTALVIYFK